MRITTDRGRTLEALFCEPSGSTGNLVAGFAGLTEAALLEAFSGVRRVTVGTGGEEIVHEIAGIKWVDRMRDSGAALIALRHRRD